MIKIETESINSYKSLMKSYTPEFVTFCICHGSSSIYRNSKFVESTFLCRLDCNGDPLCSPNDWVQVVFSYDPPISWDAKPTLTKIEKHCSNRMEVVRILRELKVDENEIHKMKSVKVKNIKEIVDESDDDVDFMSVRIRAEGEEYKFLSEEIDVIVRANKDDSQFLRVILDYTKFMETLKKEIKEAMPQPVPFLEDTTVAALVTCT